MLYVIHYGDAKAEAGRILEYALKEENWYRPAEGIHPVPGDKPEHVLHLGPYRAVFSITVIHDEKSNPEEPVRMLSVSRTGMVRTPLEMSYIGILMEIFGFTKEMRWGENEEEHTLVMVEPYLRGGTSARMRS